MPLVVQKFGGTSVQSAEARARAAEIAGRRVRAGDQLVIVVSAMGRTGDPYATDTLLGLADGFAIPLPERERDLLVGCGEIISAAVFTGHLAAAGVRAQALTGPQAGLVACGTSDSTIGRIETSTLRALLERGIVPVVAGYQAASPGGDLATLGRGGSDTSACAIGVALGADRVEIFTDVDGIMSADPRIVEDAELLSSVTYAEASALARNGARVVHPDALGLAESFGLEVAVRNTFSETRGTRVTLDAAARQVTGVANFPASSYFRISRRASGDPGEDLSVFHLVGEAGISVHFIDIGPHAISFLSERHNRARVAEILHAAGFEFTVDDRYARVAVIGAGMTGQSGMMSKVIAALQAANIRIYQSTDAQTSISCLVGECDAVRAAQVLHEAFGLDRAGHVVSPRLSHRAF